MVLVLLGFICFLYSLYILNVVSEHVYIILIEINVEKKYLKLAVKNQSNK